MKIHPCILIVAGMLAVAPAIRAEDKPVDPSKTGTVKTEPAKAAPVKPYTLTNCIITGEKLGEMGSPFVFNYQGREIKLCCKACLKEFNKDPQKYLKKIDEAEARAKADKEKSEAKPAQPKQGG
jgi:YHS domain-containing protein